ncbi:uncharacterized protein LOC116298302 [Actinia tenebrosa]|uniref:Uncharacterized protein LOC116298302 n=1 Tax=Actinia tenebrosa TaxID=6105 RepID=A0A6P8IB39_ACTTE|nr:uncharacterized protein LOC116298302 [Actinia tenebrosa]
MNNVTGAYCICEAGFTGSRCDKGIVNGSYSDWSGFGECSKSCKGGTRRRTRTCTNPSPLNGGRNCSSLGPSYEDEDCNSDVICPIIWIIIAVCCVIFLLLILLLICCIRRRKKKKRTYTIYHPGSNMNIIPLEIMVYDDETRPKPFPDGHSNPEFIPKDNETEEDDIYKKQLLLFLNQSHLIKPGMNLSYGDDVSDTSEYSNKNSRKASAKSSASGAARDEDSD